MCVSYELDDVLDDVLHNVLDDVSSTVCFSDFRTTILTLSDSVPRPQSNSHCDFVALAP